jgi:flavin-dependent dehydrogenase
MTTSPAEFGFRISSFEFPVLVVGAGPAGSVVARELARLGTRVLLVDRATFPRPKVCGCCLNAAGIAALRAAGLGHVLTELGAVPLRRVRLAAGRADADVPLPGGVAVSRDALDLALLREAAAAGATVRTGVRAAVEDDGEAVRVQLSGYDVAPTLPPADTRAGQLRSPSPPFPLKEAGPRGLDSDLHPAAVVLASGLPTRTDPAPGSRLGAGVALPAGAVPAFFSPGTIFMATGRGGYVGLVRLEDGRLDLAAAFDPAFVKTAGGLGPAAAAVLTTTRWPALPGLADAPWKGTPALTRTPAAVAGRRTFAVGDAAGYVEPFTGEGMAWAVAGAAALAPIVHRAAAGWDEAHAAEWRRTHARIIRGRQGVCRAAARALRSPTFTAVAVRALALLPALARPVTFALNRPAPGHPA